MVVKRKTLIVCRSADHIVEVKRAFNWDATYTIYGATMSGERFDRIIVFSPLLFGRLTPVKQQLLRDSILEKQCRLAYGGEWIML